MKVNDLSTRLAKSFSKSFGKVVRRGRQGARIAAVAGGMAFAGAANADVVLSEDFEGPSPDAWSHGFGTYATTDNYSGDPHASVPDGGAFYGHLIGVDDGGETPNGYSTSQTINLDGANAAIVAAGGYLNFDGWLASYTSNDDYAAFRVEFYDGADGTGLSLGFTDIVDGSNDAGVVTTPAGDWNRFNWSNYATNVAIPTTAASVAIQYDGRAVANNGNDAYTDNLTFSVDANATGVTMALVPEPTSLALLGWGTAVAMSRRRRK